MRILTRLVGFRLVQVCLSRDSPTRSRRRRRLLCFLLFRKKTRWVQTKHTKERMHRRTSIRHEPSNPFATRRTKTKRESIEDFNAAKREENKNDKRETIRVHTLIIIKRNNRYHISKYHRIKLEHVVNTRNSLHHLLLLLYRVFKTPTPTSTRLRTPTPPPRTLVLSFSRSQNVCSTLSKPPS